MTLQQMIAIFGTPGVLYFVLYYRLVKRGLRIRVKNEEIEAITKVTHTLELEIERKDRENIAIRERLTAVETEQTSLKRGQAILETRDMNNVIALAAVSQCDHPEKECPICNKMGELRKRYDNKDK